MDHTFGGQSFGSQAFGRQSPPPTQAEEFGATKYCPEGLEYLLRVDKMLIKELPDLDAKYEPENKFRVNMLD
jgi:hypothetical protein